MVRTSTDDPKGTTNTTTRNSGITARINSTFTSCALHCYPEPGLRRPALDAAFRYAMGPSLFKERSEALSYFRPNVVPEKHGLLQLAR